MYLYKLLPLSLLCRDLRENLFVGQVPAVLQTSIQESRTAELDMFCGLETVFNFYPQGSLLSEAVRRY